jgi:type III secretory pathway component EscT
MKAESIEKKNQSKIDFAKKSIVLLIFFNRGAFGAAITWWSFQFVFWYVYHAGYFMENHHGLMDKSTINHHFRVKNR